MQITRRLSMADKRGGRVQVSMWMDEEIARKIQERAAAMNNTISGTAGYYVKLGLLTEERKGESEGRASA
jgi:hypothetical protein